MSQFYGQNIDGTYPVGYTGPRGTLTGGINNTGSANNYGAGSGYRGGGGVVGSPMDFLNNSSPPPYSPSSSYWNNTGIAGGGYAPNQAPAPAGGNGSSGGGGFFTGGGFNFGDLFNTGLDYYTGQQGIDSARAAGGLALGTASGIGQTAADMAKFKPYTVTGNLATGQQLLQKVVWTYSYLLKN